MMKIYLLKKTATFLFSIYLIITATFFFMKLLPGDPFSHIENLPIEILRSLKAYYGLDKPLYIQYFTYLKGFVTFDFGPSFIYQNKKVSEIIAQGFPVTAFLGLQSLFFSLCFGLLIGAFSAYRKDKKTSFVLGSIFLSIPGFVLASLLQYIFAIKLHLLPVARFESYAHTILPTITLSVLPTIFISRLFKDSLSRTLDEDYIKFAYMKGFSKRQVFFRHGLKNSFLPVLAYLGPLTTYLLTGSFVTEKIFAIPGLGMWMISSILSRDYSFIMGLTVFYSTIVLLVNFLVDIGYHLLDPRINLKKQVNLKLPV